MHDQTLILDLQAGYKYIIRQEEKTPLQHFGKKKNSLLPHLWEAHKHGKNKFRIQIKSLAAKSIPVRVFLIDKLHLQKPLRLSLDNATVSETLD